MVGTSILHYNITAKLGEGGMGVVYLAEDTKLDRKVALKFLSGARNNTDEQLQRFQNEAKTAAALSHPNISQIYAIEESEQGTFIVMEFVDGRELRNIIKEGDPINNEQKENIARQVAQGLQAAHKKDILHRDIKSGNIMVREDGRVKVMDFGLARVSDSTHITKTGETLGTTAYMAPEQIIGLGSDERAEIWAYGVVLYELYTGLIPFDGLYDQAVTYAILEEEPTSIRDINPDTPTHIQAIINRCLEKDPESRYQSFSEILDDFTNHELEYTKKNSVVPHRRKKKQANKTWLYAGVPIALSIIVVISVLILNPRGIFSGIGSGETQRLAIIPFTNIGDSDDNRILLDGVLETMTSKLSQIDNFESALWVIPSSEVIRNDIQTPGQANKMFGVNLAVTGSLQDLNDSKRLTINLVDARNLRQLKSTVIDISESNLVNLQTESVLQLIDLLNIEADENINRTITLGASTEPGASEFYLNGLGYLVRFDQDDNLDNAIQLFKRAIEIDNEYALAYAALGEGYWKKYEETQRTTFVDSARTALNKALEINEELTPVQLTLGLLFTGTGEYDEAIEVYSNILEKEPKNDTAQRRLASTYDSMGESDLAETAYLKAIQLKPDYWDGYEKLGNFYLFRGEYDKSIEAYEQTIDLTPDNHNGYSNLGAVYYYTGQYEQAKTNFEKSLSLKETEMAASNLGTVYYIQGNLEDAITSYELALEFNPNNYNVWGNLASANGVLGNKEKEQEFYRTAIMVAKEQYEVNPNDIMLNSSLGSYYSDIGDSTNAVIYIEKTMELGSDIVDLVFRAATAYEKLGNREMALFWIEDAIKKDYPISNIENQPELTDLIADPRFIEITKSASN